MSEHEAVVAKMCEEFAYGYVDREEMDAIRAVLAERNRLDAALRDYAAMLRQAAGWVDGQRGVRIVSLLKKHGGMGSPLRDDALAPSAPEPASECDPSCAESEQFRADVQRGKEILLSKPEPAPAPLVLAAAEFDALLEYSDTLPTGTTPGKRWRRRHGNGWLMGEYGESRGGKTPITWREIVRAEPAPGCCHEPYLDAACAFETHGRPAPTERVCRCALKDVDDISLPCDHFTAARDADWCVNDGHDRACHETAGEHRKHPTGDYCTFCLSQWPCEEAPEDWAAL